MTDIEKSICDDVLRCGTIISDEEFESEGNYIRQYVITLDSEEYHLTKWDGEWIYFYHSNNRR